MRISSATTYELEPDTVIYITGIHGTGMSIKFSELVRTLEAEEREFPYEEEPKRNAPHGPQRKGTSGKPKRW